MTQALYRPGAGAGSMSGGQRRMVTQVRAASQHSLVLRPGEVSSLEEVITSEEGPASEVT